MEIYDIQKNQGLEAKKAGIKPVVDGNKKLSKVDAAKLVNRLYEEAVKDRKEQQLKRIENLKKECIKSVIKKKPLHARKKNIVPLLQHALNSAAVNMQNIYDICSLKISANNPNILYKRT